MQQITGYIERITFTNPENGFTVARLKEGHKSELTTIVGIMPTLQPGENICCDGSWKQNSSHGLQFDVTSYHSNQPADLSGIQKYLESGLIKGIGPVYAKRIVDKFGLQTLSIIDEAPQELLKVEGLGQKKLNCIKQCWQEQKSIRDIMLFLQQFGVTPTLATRIYKAWGPASIEKVKSNPFSLARDIHGVGFKTADLIASKMGIAPDSDVRVQAGLEHLLITLSEEGHVCYPKSELITLALQTLQVEQELITRALDMLTQEKRIVLQQLPSDQTLIPTYWLKVWHICEIGIASEVQRLMDAPSHLRSVDTEKALEWVQKTLNIELAPQQNEAVACALHQKMMIITGGPGTGKSTITKAILAIYEKFARHILLAAPTGRAAKRMSEITGRLAKTIHSLLEYDFKKGGFKRGRDYPLVCDLIIVDESSMIDTHLMYSLLKAIPPSARLILIGDINQLPSVGPGNVLQDLIVCKQIPTSNLTQIFRQAAGSRIITGAHSINQGRFPNISGGPKSDFFFLEAKEPQQVSDLIVSLASLRLPQKYKLHPINDIQILAPMKKGPIGTFHLNTLLQKALNPQSEGVFFNGQTYLVGDKVMQLRNNYDREVYNGDVGLIADINRSEQQVLVAFDHNLVAYDFTELDELTLAYAVSVHKYQGSECPCIIMPVHTSHYMMLHRNLLYTGVTRGRKLVVLVGTKQALALGVQNDEVKKRYTGLVDALITHCTRNISFIN